MASTSRAAARIDKLLARVAVEFRTLPRSIALAYFFREALSAQGLPGGYAIVGKVARPLAESLKQTRD